MYKKNSEIMFSPSDLTLYMDSPFASWMEHYVIDCPESKPEPDPHDAMLSLLQEKGNTHELSLLTEFQSKKELYIENLLNVDNAVERTLIAMQTGADVIYQAALQKLPFSGFADFLVKVSGDSDLGDYYYEVWDTKLSKTMKPYFIMQVCCYSEMLEEIQGRRPENIVIVLGDKEQVRLNTNNYFYYYKKLKELFLDAHKKFDLTKRPDPSDSVSLGRWKKYGESILLNADHLSQIATITRSQIKKLNHAGISTVQGLVENNICEISGIHTDVLLRLKSQAKLQKESKGKTKPSFKILTSESNQKKGLALLPPPSSLDVFFDIEGFPLEDGGLEYLWGSTFFDAHGVRQFKDFWAHNRKEEELAFKEFIEWVYGRWKQDSTMHIYHYANYEIAACRKLMGRYGICEYEVDQLLRNEVFVDLYKIVKGGLLLGEPKYSIKNVEHLYRDKRETNVGSGSDSVVVYENWRENPDGETWRTSKLLSDIRDYNIDDCNSTQELVDWLRDQQKENHIKFIGKKEFIEPETKEEVTERTKLRDTLLEQSINIENINALDAAIMKNFAWSLEFHRRENKPVFWRLFDRLGMDDEDLFNDFECLANCTRTEKMPFKPTSKARNFAYEYRFDPNQEFKGASKSYYILGEEAEDGKKCKVSVLIDESNLQEGLIVVQAKNEPPKIITLVPDEYINPDPIPNAIYSQAKNFLINQFESCAILDFLKRNIPNIDGHQVGKSIAPSQDHNEKMQQIIQAAVNLKNSYLVIQGPPGAGKTYTGKHIIAELLKRGNRIGICSNSHKAINHLLISTAKYCNEIGVSASFICTNDTDPVLESLGVKILDNNKLVSEIKERCVVGTTAWGFSRDDLVDTFDYLVIDEAGQVSVANLIAISRATKNIILMGDQMQLGQPSQGSHPAESGLSTLDYLLHDKPTIPEDLGVFLDTTYRMHSSVNQFISDAIYEGKLKIDYNNDRQIILIPDNYSGVINKEAGIIYVPVEHEGNTQASDEEVIVIRKLVDELRGRVFINKKGEKKLIDWSDILFVAPYNYQVNKLRGALGNNARVGSVDKFQGQEAPVVFLSMCASNADESPRGLDFLLDKHRLNVAISRAQCLAIVVASPSLSQISATNIQQLEMANVFCRLMKES